MKPFYQDPIHMFAVSPSFDEDGICFVARQSGFFYSDDGGRSWMNGFSSLNLAGQLPATALVLSPNFAQDRTLFVGTTGGILRSTDGADTWHVARTQSTRTTVSTLALSPCYEEDGIVLAGTFEDGVLCSADKGERWTGWNFGLSDLQVYTLALSPTFAIDETVFIGTESGLLVSHNQGRAWRELAFPMEHGPVLSIALSPNFGDDGIALAGTISSGLWQTQDKGETWTARFCPDGGSIHQVFIPRNYVHSGEPFALCNESILCSQDGGHRWNFCEHTEPVIALTIPATVSTERSTLVALTQDDVVRTITHSGL
ncbi:hypothetical protein KFU94_24325 [Chloroflexi bacterium TSY]|nr:hypothetical protein [Chloroflexi bacterium TSY]